MNRLAEVLSDDRGIDERTPDDLDEAVAASATGRYGQMKGPATDCEHPCVPAGEVEQVILGKIRELCADPTVRAELAKRLQ
ncbi:MAG: hypothetical protein IPK13_11755 [Deltaproteobacteria bacterium]|nr:hypothetical protein [Deltaproteobacteria bacterium]